MGDEKKKGVKVLIDKTNADRKVPEMKDNLSSRTNEILVLAEKIKKAFQTKH